MTTQTDTLQQHVDNLVELTACVCPGSHPNARDCVAEWREDVVAVGRAAGMSVPG